MDDGGREMGVGERLKKSGGFEWGERKNEGGW